MIEVVVGDDILACLCCMTSQRKNRQAIAVAGGINDKMFKFDDLPAICSIDIDTRKKVIELIQVFIEQPYLFNGKKLY